MAMVSVREAAALAGIHPNNLRRHQYLGHITAYRVNGRVQYDTDELAAKLPGGLPGLMKQPEAPTMEPRLLPNQAPALPPRAASVRPTLGRLLVIPFRTILALLVLFFYTPTFLVALVVPKPLWLQHPLPGTIQVYFADNWRPALVSTALVCIVFVPLSVLWLPHKRKRVSQLGHSLGDGARVERAA